MPQGQIVEFEVCIVGGGAAGLTVARELAGHDFRVCLLESGGLHEDEEAQRLSSGTTIGNHQISLGLRQRQYGGSANRWCIQIGEGELGVRYAPLDEIDFERRDWLPYSGWPFGKAQLDPFYARAHQLCGIGPYSYESKDWEDSRTPRLPLPEHEVCTNLFQFGPRSVFTQEIPCALNRTANVTAYLHANVVGIETDDVGQSSTRVKVACLNGNQFSVTAKYFVLAAGGIESARLLLLSDRVQPSGLGNHNDLVGRFFMVHPQFHHDRFTPISPRLFDQARLYDLHRVNRTRIMGRLSLSREVMEREHLLNIGAMLLPRERNYWPARRTPGPFIDANGASRLPPRGQKYFNMLKARLADLGTRLLSPAKNSTRPLTLERGGWSHFGDVEKRYATFEMASLVEQAPNPANRVMLGFERDPLGARCLELHWRWSESDNSRLCGHAPGSARNSSSPASAPSS